MNPDEGHRLTPTGFVQRARLAFGLLLWQEQEVSSRIERAGDYVLAAARAKAPQAVLEQLPLNPKSKPWTVLVSVEQWEAILQRCAPRAATNEEWRQLVVAYLNLECRDEHYDYADPRVMMAVEELKEAPDFIRDADLDLADRQFLARATADLPDDALVEAKRETIRLLRARDGWLLAANGDKGALEVLHMGEISQHDAREIAATWSTTFGSVEVAFDKAVGQIADSLRLKERDALFSDSNALLNAAIEQAKTNAVVRQELLNGVPAYEVLRQRISTLPEAERRLLCGLLWNGPHANAVSLHGWFNQLKARDATTVERTDTVEDPCL